MITDRDQLPTLFDSRGYTGNGLEVGVFEGYFAAILSKAYTKYYGVDTWTKSSMSDVAKKLPDAGLFNSDSLNPWFMGYLRSFFEPFDWIYLDGDHTYEHVAKELPIYWDLVRSGGLLCGHDYVVTGEHPSQPGFIYGVKQAVDEFVASNGLKLHITSEPHGFLTWILEKP